MNNYTHTMLGLDSIRLGWALVHFLWQGLVIALLLELALGLVGRKNASLRYVLCGLALAAMPVCLMDTYLALDRESYTVPAQPILVGTAAIDPTSPQGTPEGFALLPVVHMITDFTSRKILSLELNRCIPGVVACWLMGVVILTGRKAGGFVVLWRLRRRGLSTPDDAMCELCRQACDKIGVDPRRVYLGISSLVQVPMTMGWLKPVVLFPAALLSGLSTGEIELLLAHELAHIRRCDYLVNLVQTVVETLFFYHPVTLWISRRMRQERENSCDDLVAARSTEILAYANVLFRLESLRPPGASLVTAANGGSLLQRIQRLADEPTPTPGMGLPMLLALLSIFGVITAVSTVKAQTAPSDATPSTNAASATGSTPSMNTAPAANSTPSTETAPATTNATSSTTTTATPSRGGGAGSPTFANASFETPVADDYNYTPADSGWTFTNDAGITKTGDGTAYGALTPPDGIQTALLQGASGTLGTMSQSVNFSAGTYTISFYGAQRYDQVQPIQVSVDGTAVGTYTPASNTFAKITTAAFKVTPGNHTVTFAATDNSADKTSFIDLVSINVGGGNAPAVTPGLPGPSTNAAPATVSTPSTNAAPSTNSIQPPAAASAATNAAPSSAAAPSN